VVAAVKAAHRGERYLSSKITGTVIDDYIRRRRSMDVFGPLGSLSAREREVLQLVAEGKSSTRIATAVGLSPRTVETYRRRLMHKLGIHDLPALIKFAMQHGLTPMD
jgi:two-component system, NarL family, response regulator NreC